MRDVEFSPSNKLLDPSYKDQTLLIPSSDDVPLSQANSANVPLMRPKLRKSSDFPKIKKKTPVKKSSESSQSSESFDKGDASDL